MNTIDKLMMIIKKVMEQKGYQRIRFSILQYKNDDEESIDVLDLKARANHALKSYGIKTVKDLISTVYSSNDVKKIRNMGDTSVKEVMTKLLSLAIARNIECDRKPFEGIELR